jgi:hypothetical protein
MTTKSKKSKRVSPETKIIVVKRENPCRSGTAAHKRVAAVLRCHGRTVRDALRYGARTSTVRYLATAGLIRAA